MRKPLALPLILCLAFTVTSCNNGSPEPTPTKPNTPTASASASQPPRGGDVADPGQGVIPTTENTPEAPKPVQTLTPPPPLSSAQTKVAQQYADARENMYSYYRKSTRDWLKDIKPISTKDFYKQQYDSTLEDTGGTWQTAHDKKISTKTILDCALYPEATDPHDKSHVAIMCGLTDRPLQNGKPMATTKIPANWPYAGEQENLVLMLVKSGSSWRVDGDYSGQAG